MAAAAAFNIRVTAALSQDKRETKEIKKGQELEEKKGETQPDEKGEKKKERKAISRKQVILANVIL